MVRHHLSKTLILVAVFLGFIAVPAQAQPNQESSYEGAQGSQSERIGSHTVQGVILEEYRQQGGPSGFLGHPTTEERKLRNGLVQAFQGGEVHWSPRSGAHATHGAIHYYWQTHNWENGFLGYPTSDESQTKGGSSQRFEHGIIFWSARTGAHAAHGKILSEYAAIHYNQSPARLPNL